jgi:hypothetical protein
VSKTKKSIRFIAAYDAHGRRMRSYSLEAALRHVADARAVPTFSRRGTLTAITFRPTSTRPATVLKTAHMGQRYSYPERVGEHYAWTHAPMLSPRTLSHLAERELEAEQAELYLMAIFRAVPLSCMRPAPEPPANVVRIDSARRKRGNAPEKVAA